MTHRRRNTKESGSAEHTCTLTILYSRRGPPAVPSAPIQALFRVFIFFAQYPLFLQNSVTLFFAVEVKGCVQTAGESDSNRIPSQIQIH